MEATLERKEVVQEETYIVRFQNLEQKGTDLEFSAGMPITKNIQSYVFKEGLAYNVSKALRDHVNDLSYPVYKDVEDPNFPGSGIIRSMQSGVDFRFALMSIDNKPDLVVYEHLRDKLNQKVLPGALNNASAEPGNTTTVGVVINEQEQSKLKTDNKNYARENFKQAQDIKDLVNKVNELKSTVRGMKR